MRQLGDLAFLLQNYELSYLTYNSVRKDYQVDHAWLLYAGAVVSQTATHNQMYFILLGYKYILLFLYICGMQVSVRFKVPV